MTSDLSFAPPKVQFRVAEFQLIRQLAAYPQASCDDLWSVLQDGSSAVAAPIPKRDCIFVDRLHAGFGLPRLCDASISPRDALIFRKEGEGRLRDAEIRTDGFGG